MDEALRSLAGPYVDVQFGIGETDLLFVGTAVRKAVVRGLVHPFMRDSEVVSDCEYLSHGKVGQQREVSGPVSEFGGVAYVVLGEVAGVDHTGVFLLADCIEGGHSQPRRNVLDAGIGKVLAGGGNSFKETVKGFLYVDRVHLHPQMPADQVGVVRSLAALRHGHTYHPFRAECPAKYGGADGRVFSATHSKNRLGAFRGFPEIISDPFDKVFCGLCRIKTVSFHIRRMIFICAHCPA